MNRKGFTLVELIAAIIILALVLAIAFASVNVFIDSFKERQHNNIIKAIENAASKYAFDTGKTEVLVDDLIINEYYEPDNDQDEIIDPQTNEKLNCYAVEMEKKGSYYKASFKSDRNFVNGNECNKTDFQNHYS